MLQLKFLETAVGVFIAIGLASLLMLSMKVSNLSSLASDNGYVIKAHFLNRSEERRVGKECRL